MHFDGCFEDVKDYELLQTHSNEIIIRKDVKVDEHLSKYNLNSTFVPYSIPKFCTFYITLISSLNEDNGDENAPLPTHLPPIGSIEPKLVTTPLLHKWVYTTRSSGCSFISTSYMFTIPNEPLIFWLTFQILMIHKHLHKLIKIYIGR